MTKPCEPRYYTRSVLKAIAPSIVKGGILLDLGAGTAKYRTILEMLVDEYLTMDLVKGREIKVTADAHYLPLRDHCLDYILCTSVIEHLEDPSRSISEMSRCLKSNGTLLLSTCFIYPFHRSPNDYYRFTAEGLLLLLEKHGFKDVKIIKLGGLPSCLLTLWFKCLEVARTPLAKVFLKIAYLMKSLLEALVDRLDDIVVSEDGLGFFTIARRS